MEAINLVFKKDLKMQHKIYMILQPKFSVASVFIDKDTRKKDTERRHHLIH